MMFKVVNLVPISIIIRAEVIKLSQATLVKVCQLEPSLTP